MSSDIRYRAEWVISMGEPRDGEEWSIDDIDYGRRLFRDRQKAIDHAHSYDLNNEGRVFVENWVEEYDPGFGVFHDWAEVEEIIIYEDGTIETEAIGQ